MVLGKIGLFGKKKHPFVTALNLIKCLKQIQWQRLHLLSTMKCTVNFRSGSCFLKKSSDTDPVLDWKSRFNIFHYTMTKCIVECKLYSGNFLGSDPYQVYLEGRIRQRWFRYMFSFKISYISRSRKCRVSAFLNWIFRQSWHNLAILLFYKVLFQFSFGIWFYIGNRVYRLVI